MKEYTLRSLAALVILTLLQILSPTLVNASVDDSISYRPDRDESIFDDVRLHAGAAFLNSFQDVLTSPGVRERGGIKGFDLNFGVDLFSVNWIAEGHLISYPEALLSNSRISSNGFELRLLYDTAILEGVTLHGGIGLGSRAYSIKSKIGGDSSFSSAATVLALGADYWINAQISGGVEITNHLPLVNGDEPNSIDLGVRLNGHF